MRVQLYVGSKLTVSTLIKHDTGYSDQNSKVSAATNINSPDTNANCAVPLGMEGKKAS